MGRARSTIGPQYSQRSRSASGGRSSVESRTSAIVYRGAAHVDRSIAGATEFTRDFQNLITRYAWGTIWTRPGLSRRTRRLLALAIAASLGRWEEFGLHVRTGLMRELELCDLKETLLQTAIYAGVPAANTGFHIAGEEIEKLKIG